jgi:glycogenin glucosyltransferase
MKEFKLSSLKKSYIYPQQMKRPDGTSMYAFVTFLMRNDNYLPGALMFAFGLREKGTKADLICMISGNISNNARCALSMIYDYVINIDEIFVPSNRGHERQDIPYVFTRFNALRLGADGDLGFNYKKIVVADADVLPLRFYDHLFTLDTPAGIINECKSNFIDCSDKGRYIIPETLVYDGEWKWHRIYGDICPHGHHIPKYITDRVEEDPGNLGVNSSLFVLTPSYETYTCLIESLKNPRIQELVCRKFKWPEMQYATMIWSGEWTNIDVRFSSINGYPDTSVLCGIHYAGSKPWNSKDEHSMQRVARFPDYKMWYEMYLEMTENKYKELQRIPKMARLVQHIESNLHQ